MKSKTFDNGLVVKHRKSAIIFEHAEGKDANVDRFSFQFTESEFAKFTDHILEAATEAWTNVTPKEATGTGSDYWEYYDRKYDNNGYLTLKEGSISLRAPYGSLDTLYQFNKPKVQSFIYDLQKRIRQQ